MTLAAGAAHELATPLGAIAIASKELDRDALPGRGAGGSARATSGSSGRRWIAARESSSRCRPARERTPASPSWRSRWNAGWTGALDGLPGRERVRADAGLRRGARSRPGPGHGARAPRDPDERAPGHPGRRRGVAPAPDAPGRGVAVEVEDAGAGMAPEVLARVGEPFFTTKDAGPGQRPRALHRPDAGRAAGRGARARVEAGAGHHGADHPSGHAGPGARRHGG